MNNIPAWFKTPSVKIVRAVDDCQAVRDLQNGGALSIGMEGYQERNAQIIMARTIAECIDRGESAVIEAATGTGKSLGYLIPVVRSGRTTVIATSNKALQNQIFKKDIPVVQKKIERFEAALLKGMGNFLCLDKLEKFRQGWPELITPEFDALVEDLIRRGGDFEKLTVQVEPELKTKIDGDPEECTHRKCPHVKDCFYYKMRKEADSASVIVTNHTMLLLDAQSGGKILPDYQVLVIDEAHNLEEEAQKCFSTKVTPGRISTLINRKTVKDAADPKDLEEIKEKAAQLFESFASFTKEKTILTSTVHKGIILSGLLHNLSEVLSNREGADYEKLSQRAQKVALDLHAVCTVESSNKVHFVEKKKNGTFEIACYLLDVSDALKSMLFQGRHSVLATSATISTTSEKGIETFDFFVKRTGMDPQVQKALPSVFDYEKNALLYIAPDIARPQSDDPKHQWYYEKNMAARMQQLVEMSQGRAFLLFSSNRMMEAVYKQLKVPYQVLKQGDLPKEEMIKRFKQEPSVLLGVASFREGVDIAGPMLSLVIMDKIPFDVPDDPIHKGIQQMINAETGNEWAGFNTYAIPRAIIKLKQGVGRLIRTDTDTGVMGILDSGLLKKRYGRQIRSSLPPAPITTDLKEVTAFFKKGN